MLETFNANQVNELSTISRSGTLTVAGTAGGSDAGGVSVTVSGNGVPSPGTATVYNDFTWALTNVTPANGQNTYTANATDGYGRTSQDSVTANLPSSTSFTYDANGNLLGDGNRNFAYDDENQLTSVWVTNAWRSDLVYDGLMRRRIRREYTWSSGAWLQTNEVHYVYDGRLVAQERNAANTPATDYTWGTDLGAGLQTAGGIGGLLARTDTGLLAMGSPLAHAYYHADGNGNITCLININNAISARYAYDPYGNVLSKAGPLADATLYRFSSKEWHGNSGLLYYGFRGYDPKLQRWLTRDPVGIYGGLNLYAFCRNRPIDRVDAFGFCGGEEDPDEDLDPAEAAGSIFGAGEELESDLDKEIEMETLRAQREAQEAAAAAAAERAAAEAAAQAAAAVRTPGSMGSNLNAPPSRISGYPTYPKYPPPTPIGGNFQFNFDESEDYALSRAAGVRRARSEGCLAPGEIGHHINSVQTHPQLAAEPSNIQGMGSFQDHLDAHGGNFANPTAGPLLSRP